MATPPALGYGQRDDAPIDSVNQWLRSRPEYQQLLASWGQSPNNVHLDDSQKQQVIKLAQSLGVVVDEGGNGQEVDDSGNFRPKGHGLRNALIVGGLAGAALLTAGAAGAFGGAALGGGSAAGAGGAAAGTGGALASTTIGSGFLPAIAGGTGLAGGTAGAAGALGGTVGLLGSGGVLGAADKIGSGLSALASGRAQGAQAEAGIGQSQDRNAISLYGAENTANANENNFNLGVGNLALGQSNAANNFSLNRGSLANANAATDLSQRNFALTAPQARAKNAVRGDILSRAQDVSLSGVPSGIPVPTISGGLRPSMFSADTRSLGATMSAQARAQQEKGDTFAPLPDLPTYQAPQGGLPTYKAGPAAPTLTGLPGGGATTGLANAGSILSLAPSFVDLWKAYQGR